MPVPFSDISVTVNSQEHMIVSFNLDTQLL